MRHEVAVFIAGGGPAGVAAAVCAVRQGCSVFLAEATSCFGGMGTAGMVPGFMTFGDGVTFLAKGFGRELLDRLEAAGGTWPARVPNDNQCCVGIRAEVLKRVYDDMMTGCGAGFSFHVQLIGVQMDGGRVTTAICAGKSGLFAVRATVFIDCTGDGDLAVFAGAPFEKGDPEGCLMPGTLCSLWGGIDWEGVHQSGLWAQAVVPQAIADGVITVPDRHLPGMWQVGRQIGGGNIGHAFGVDGTDEQSITRALVLSRKLLLEYETFYRQYLKGYERMELVATGSTLGIRETRRILGDYVLCLDDFKRRAVFDDEIGRYCYPVDIHASRPEVAEFGRFEEEFRTLRYGVGESYGIPYRTLIPRGLDNVLVAGRCTSCDRFLQGSVRVMPGCYITGQGAGVAAALAAGMNGQVRQVDIALMRSRLAAL